MKQIAWYDPTNGMVSTDKDSPLFTPLGQVWPLFLEEQQITADCPNCEYHRQRAQLWRDEAYRQAGHPLPKREPVAWINSSELLVMKGNAYAGAKDWRVNLGLEPEEGDVGLYTTPPQRTWVGLTELEKAEITSLKWWDWEDTFDIDGFIKAIEAKLKEKNT